MRCFNPRAKIVPTTSAFEGGVGAALYVGPPDVEDAGAINYSNQRTLVGHLIPLGDWPGDYLQHDAAVGVVKSPGESIDWTLPDAYLGTTFWVNVRPHENGLELPTLSGAQRVVADDEGVIVPAIGGTGVVVHVVQLDGGGVLVDVEWYRGETGSNPTELALESTSGPTSASVSVDYDPRQIRYALQIDGLDPDAAYEFDVIARNADASLTFGTVEITTDGTGPDPVTALTAEVES